ncbi:beta strand repeat-containing protein [Rhodosalinus sediminis]|uniref:beta strand repeat-containing protein n=2 Tax=Rhodosalinus TaxID=2047740 RepID=UPI00131458DD|nr:calcium-binding protein [Rhodosalinus sediminis]
MAKDFAGINRMEAEAGLQAPRAEVTTSTKQDITSRFVAMWEKKNAQRALRGGAVSTMALTLAACGGDDDDPVAPAEPTTPVVDLVENAGVFSLATDVDGFSVPNDGVAPEITISDDEPDDQITATLDANGAGSGTLVLDFIDENDTLTLTADSDFGSFTALEIQDGTVDVSLADLGGITSVTINSGIILTSDQLEGLSELSGTGSVEVKAETAEEADAAATKIGELGVTAPVTITAADGADISEAELEAANTAAEAAVEENNAADQPSGSLTADKTEVDEGGVVTFTISTQNVAEGTTLNYTITGVNSDDISGELSGTSTVDANGNAVISVEVAEDQLTEGAEDLTLSTTVAGEELTETVTVNDTSVTPVPTFDLSASEPAVDEGGTATFTLETENVDAGTEYSYTLSGVSAADLASGSLSGTATVDANGKAVITVDLAEDERTEGEETLTLEVAGETADVTINDTSVTQPQSFTLTTDPDFGEEFTGGDGADTFKGTDTTFTSGDDLNGGGGEDTLTVTFADGSVTPIVDLTSIETVSLRNADDGSALTLNADGWAGVTTLVNDRAENDVTLNNLSSLPTLEVIEGGGSDFTIDVDASDVDLTGSEDALTVVTRDADLAVLAVGDGNGDTVEQLTVQNTGDSAIGEITDGAGNLAPLASLTVTGSGSLDLNVGGGTPYAGLTTVDSTGVALTLDVDNSSSDAGTDTSITSTGADDDITVVGADGSATDAADTTVSLGDGDNTVVATSGATDANLTVTTGGGDDDITATDAADEQTVAITSGAGDDTLAVDVSNATDNSSTASITAGTGADEVTVTANANVALTVDLGAGNDTLTINTINATADVTDTIDGGDGVDTLRGASGDLATIEADADQLATLSGFEQLAVSDALANNLDLTAFGVDRISLEVGAASAGVITMASGDTIAFDEATLTGDVTTGALVAAVDGASDAGSNADVVNIEGNIDFVGANNFTTAGNHIDVDAVETVNISVVDTDTNTAGTGAATFTLANADNVEAISVDAAQATTVDDDGTTDFVALNSLDASSSSAAVTFSADAAGQGVTMTGGEGADDFTGSGLADVINGGAGDDVINGGAGDDVISGGAGNDTLDGGAGADNVFGGAGADVIDVGQGSDFIQINALTDGSAATGAGGTFSGFDTYTNFDADGGDVLVFDSGDNTNGTTVDTAVVDNVFVIASDDAATAANDLAADGSDRTDVDSVISFLTDAANYDETAGEVDLVAVTFAGSGDTAVYLVDNNGDTDAAAGEVTLLGTIDTDQNLNAADFVIA